MCVQGHCFPGSLTKMICHFSVTNPNSKRSYRTKKFDKNQWPNFKILKNQKEMYWRNFGSHLNVDIFSSLLLLAKYFAAAWEPSRHISCSNPSCHGRCYFPCRCPPPKKKRKEIQPLIQSLNAVSEYLQSNLYVCFDK